MSSLYCSFVSLAVCIFMFLFPSATFSLSVLPHAMHVYTTHTHTLYTPHSCPSAFLCAPACSILLSPLSDFYVSTVSAIAVVESPSHAYLVLCDPMDCSMLDFLIPHHLWSLPKFLSVGLVMPSNHLILCCPLLLLPLISPSIKVFSNESALPIRWPKYWSFSFSIGPFKAYSG